MRIFALFIRLDKNICSSGYFVVAIIVWILQEDIMEEVLQSLRVLLVQWWKVLWWVLYNNAYEILVGVPIGVKRFEQVRINI